MPAPTRKRWILISGASTGIGRALTLDLLALGYHVMAGVRKDADADELRRLASAQSPQHGRTLETMILDVTKAEDIQRAKVWCDTLAAQGDSLWALINNAGIVVVSPAEFIPIDELRKQMDVNFIGAVALTQAALSALRSSRGRVLNISTISGRLSLPFTWPYSASKYAMEAWSDGLRMELRPLGVEVVLIEPGSIQTPIWEKSLRTNRDLFDRLPETARTLYGTELNALQSRIEQTSRGADVSIVCKAVRKALSARSPRTRTLVGTDAKVLIWFKRLLPDRWFDAFIRKGLTSSNSK